ncbi:MULTISPECIES: ABC transporter family substrate-binding protein [unclassified Corynebacterium]|uniref:ABC transporter family substrate-binding protein n=1 Tax=unclassified Corynebacterium TaxID=2624378 RepID=UPI0029CA8581|nr:MULTISPECIES: ABC transporter family substrate-binding protein [unclassified Corynebacterium]WPF66952.1 ABC transporter family substrate-binding protein [Corynebacterium sp. 22KM0430]WPF69440.1 ABC transporter family substrate-binding protein [Corynebacterium sp. 21KM1197]
MSLVKKQQRALVAVVLAACAAGCAANPSPPPVVDTARETAAPTTTSAARSAREEPKRTSISVGIDPLSNGFNPHLLADSTPFVRSLADLVLPSAFVAGAPNPDLVISAEQIEPAPEVAQTVRYVLTPESQWSDGTPVSGNDFVYLWQSMRDTPGVLGEAGYRAIADVRTTGGGKTVEVDFAHPIAQWQGLFSHLLPAHLMQGTDFEAGMRETIPASAGRYMVRAVDRARGTVELSRNDRFWGSNPAATELLIFRPVRGTTEGADQLRSHQLSYLDITPAETSVQAFSLVPESRVHSMTTGRELALTMSVTSPTLADAPLREALSALIDVPALARLAAGRSADLAVPEHPVPEVAEETLNLLRERAAAQPLRIAADPTDGQAAAAVRGLADSLVGLGVQAQAINADLSEVAEQGLGAGEVDAVVSWRSSEPDAVEAASRYSCPVETLRGSNLSGYCSPETQDVIGAVLAGAEAPEALRAVEETEHLSVPLLRETRLMVAGPEVEGLPESPEQWQGLTTAAQWTKR